MTPLSRNQISMFLGRIVQDVEVLRAALKNNGTNEDNSAEEYDYLHIQAGLDRAKEAIDDAVLVSNRSTEGNVTPETIPQGKDPEVVWVERSRIQFETAGCPKSPTVNPNSLANRSLSPASIPTPVLVDAPTSPTVELSSLHGESAQVQGDASRRSSPQSLENPFLSSPRASSPPFLGSPIRFRRDLPSFSPPSFPTPTRLGSAIRRPSSFPISSPTLPSTPLAPSSRTAFYWPMIHANAHGSRRGTPSSPASRAPLSGSTVGDKGSFLLDLFVGHVSEDDLSESDGEELEDISSGRAASSEAVPSSQERGRKRKAALTEHDGSRAAKHRQI